jgi:hypothetical protein
MPSTATNQSPCFNTALCIAYQVKYLLYIPKHIQEDATSHCLLYLEAALHVSGGTSTHHQEHIQLYLQHLLFVTPLLLPAAIVEEFGR